MIAGSARGVRLAEAPSGVRPTGDRVREGVFNSLGQFFSGGEALDLYAGTGTLGIEALSRGCERAVFVERDRRAVETIRENLRRTGFEGRGEVVRGEVRRLLERRARPMYNDEFRLIFADPPYRIAPDELEGVLGALELVLAPGGKAVIESGVASGTVSGAAFSGSTEIQKGVSRRYGDTVVTIFERLEPEMTVAVCPGSFDPITVGHLDVIRRASRVFDHLVVAVGSNREKNPRMDAHARAALIERVTRDMPNVSVEVMEGLLVEFARGQGARVIVKGLRAVSDFDSEFEQAQLNQTLDPEVETMFIMSSAEHSFLSSSAIREIARFGGDVSRFVPQGILGTVREVYSGDSGVSDDYEGGQRAGAGEQTGQIETNNKR
ncbi:pantetheine-phosphate adenylyltransferase [Rubrobacter aplysinae]|uniref:pantetheine-phosphate adenylyltransferase n=1 Tax=Rubrobacter aplysinae TaxID=909625 RepID=UPI001F39A39E|nr:pantetheine-phosphate adenylyltransferase [Rubrobacter aplysinae]